MADSELRILTDRLDLEPLRRDHAEVMFPILLDPSLYRYTGGEPPVSVDALAELYARWELRRSPDGSQRWLNWILRERALKVAIGYAQATVTSSYADVAWVVGSPWQGRGYATEAAKAVVQWLGRLGVSEIRACVNPTHVASQKVALRAGLRRTEQISNGEEIWVYDPSSWS